MNWPAQLDWAFMRFFTELRMSATLLLNSDLKNSGANSSGCVRSPVRRPLATALSSRPSRLVANAEMMGPVVSSAAPVSVAASMMRSAPRSRAE